MKRNIFLISLVLLVFVVWKNRSITYSVPHEEVEETSAKVSQKPAQPIQNLKAETFKEKESVAVKEIVLRNLPKLTVNSRQQMNENRRPANTDNLVTYTVDGAIAVTQGDMVLGEFQPGAFLNALSGHVKEPEIKTWPTSEIPYFVQANLPNPERVQTALQMFGGTHVRFIPYNNQTDAIVFERGTGVCKSYVGYIGGLQKIFLADACSAREIAHEVMHALGFIHEQNRIDRDAAVRILWENIDDNYKVNFEKFSSEAMKVSGRSRFDFESIMIYPETMFSLNGQPTMKSLIEQQFIAPKSYLSVKDVERINQVY